MAGFTPRVNLPRDLMGDILRYLIPTHNDVMFYCDSSNKFIDCIGEYIISACSKLKNNKAPGPGNVLDEVIKAVAKQKPNYLLSVYNELAKTPFFRPYGK